jgi:transcriptional antiterminator RfaH
MNQTKPNFISSIVELSREWHIAYTYPKAERKVSKKLENLGVASFLPLHNVIRNWSDRKKKLEVPIFPNYIFVYTSRDERYDTLQIKEIVKYVSFDGKPVTVSEAIINSVKTMLKGNVEVSDEEYFEGMHIKVTDGVFSGAEGILVRKNSRSRLVIQIEALRRTISVDISSNSVAPLHNYASDKNFKPQKKKTSYSSGPLRPGGMAI